MKTGYGKNRVMRDAAYDMAGLLSGNRTEEFGREVAEYCAQNQTYRCDMDATAELMAKMAVLEGSDLVEEIARSPVRVNRLPRFAWAAVILMAVSIGWLVWPPAENINPQSSFERYMTSVGEQKQITLPDGSTLDLNTNTEVLVAYQGNMRQVILKRGEAFFDVLKAADSPFVVDVDRHSVTVLGTSFNMRKDPGLISVAVSKGAVAVHRQEEQVDSDLRSINDIQKMESNLFQGGQYRLESGQKVEIFDDTLKVSSLKPDGVGSWRGGVLGFVDTPLFEVVKEINRYSGKKILIEDADIMNLLINATIKVNRIGVSVRGLEMSHQIQARHYVDRIVLVGK